MATTRVYILAKELGVKSKAIVEKCQAEGLDVKNHMSTISAGLGATIREWFSEGIHSTTVEVTDHVDLKKVRVKKKKAKKNTEAETEAETELEPEAKAAAVETDQTADTQPQIIAETGEPEPEPESVEPEPEPEPVKLKPEPVVPAGPMMTKPSPVKLTGPRVIRVEAPEVDKPFRPKPKPRPSRVKHNESASEPLMLSAPKDISTVSKRGKKGAKRKTHGRRHETTDANTEKERSVRKIHSKDLEERRARLEAAGGEGLRMRPTRRIEIRTQSEDLPAHIRPEKAIVSEPITVKDLSAAMGVKIGDIITQLMRQGTIATANQTIATDVAELIAIDFGVELVVELQESLEQKIAEKFENRAKKNIQRRPPIVTMLGHVDHGKTSLLDRIRSSQIASGEAGGITQHIGSYQVEVGGKKVTFLDTPGHAAFTAMRARGANMTDIVVLVIAADDGVMPQTAEAIHHAKAAGVSIIVALNKIDLPGIDTNRIYGQLAEHELTPTEWGGDIEVVKTSATTGQGIEDLIEHLDYLAELRQFSADPTIPATGWVIEAKMSTTQGAVATVLIKEGKLKKGDIVFAGKGCGRVRTLKNCYGKNIPKAVSSMPVEISGLSDVPQAGDSFFCLKDINTAKEVAEDNRQRSRQKTLTRGRVVTLENLFSQIEAGKVKEVNVILRADVQGSVDVLLKYLTDLNTDEVGVRILHAAVGGITEGDVVLAEASGAIIIGFNVVPEDAAAKAAEISKVDIRLYNIIYRITEDLRKAMSGMLEPEEKENHLGKLTVRDTFKVSNAGTIAGCFVNDGQVARNARLRLIRDNIVIKDKCVIGSLKHFKDDVREVKAGLECGIKIDGFDDIKIGDVFEAYEIVQIARTI